ncbi:MAG: hypothetical protein KUG69_10950 [Marinosulfonomonas sp.]|nr:hypothetical protein [Marinosulfonomonas sp.]
MINTIQTTETRPCVLADIPEEDGLQIKLRARQPLGAFNIRAGMHAVGHQYTREQVRQIARALDVGGVDRTEVSHGGGFAGGSFNYGFGRHVDRGCYA